MAIIATHESTANVSTSRAVRDVDKGIAYVNPDDAPLTVILMRAKGSQRTAVNPKFEWIEKDMDPPRWDQANGTAVTTGELTLDVDNGEYFRVNDLVKVMTTGEIVQVTAITTDALTIVRSVGDASGSAADTIADDADLRIIGNVSAQGADVAAPRSHEETYVHNFTQIFRTSFGTTRTEAAAENYTGPDRPRLRKEKAAEHRRDIEAMLLYGERSGNLGTSNAPAWATGGLNYYLTSNIKTSVGTLTEPEVWDLCEDVFQPTGGGNSRLWVASPLTCTTVDLLAGARLQTVPKEDTFGVAIKQWVTSHGTLNIVKHHMLTNGAGGGGWGGESFFLDMKRIKYVPFTGASTKLLTNRQGNGEDKFTDEYLTEAGFQVENPIYHGKFEGLTG